jgi:hypothetical protein
MQLLKFALQRLGRHEFQIGYSALQAVANSSTAARSS